MQNSNHSAMGSQFKNAEKKVLMDGFHERLKFAMGRRAFSQSALARKVDITQPLVHYWLKGSDLPRKYHAQKLAWALGVSYDWLTLGIKEPFAFRIYPIDEFWSAFPERLAYLLWIKELNIIKLKKIVKKETASMWLDGDRYPTDEDLDTLSKYLMCSKIWLVNGNTHITTDENRLAYQNWIVSNYKMLFDVTLSQVSFNEKMEMIIR
jgi:transcriptional regulator with XRE-family HTH domain